MMPDNNLKVPADKQLSKVKWKKKRRINRASGCFTENDMYNYYKRNKDGSNYDIDRKLYKEILFRFHKKGMKYMIEDSGELCFPCYLGKMSIRKTKPLVNKENSKVSYAKDYYNSKKYGKKIYHMNNHTNGYIMRFFWSKTNSLATRVRGSELYNFRAVRKNREYLSRIVNKYYPQIDYFERDF